MPTKKVCPYLNFAGNCREAMSFYQSCLGGDLQIKTFGEIDPSTPATMKDQVMHAELSNDTLSFMASDCPPEMRTLVVGNNVYMSLVGDDPKLKDAFAKLSAGGEIEMPLGKQIWGDEFGSFTDKFGILWMVNISEPKV